MSERHLDPARSVITKIGIEKVAEVTGKHISRVYRWMYPKERGGTGGVIPHADAATLLAYSREHGIPLSASEFLEPAGAVTPGAEDAA